MNLSASLIICTYKRKQWVENLLVSIAEQTVMPKETIIVDASPEKIRYSTPKCLEIIFLKSDKMQLTYQRNLGVAVSSGDIILHLDDDTYLEQDFIENILKVFTNDTEQKIGAVTGYVINQWGKNENFPNLIFRIAKLLGLYTGDFTPGSVATSGQSIELVHMPSFSGIKKVDRYSGTSHAIRREVYKNYQHPEIINKYGGEDKAFSMMIRTDWDIYVCGDAKLLHFSAPGGARTNKFQDRKSTAIINLFIQSEYNNKNNFRLRLFYIYIGLWQITVALIMVVSIVKFKKSSIWFLGGAGWIAGAMSNGLKN